MYESHSEGKLEPHVNLNGKHLEMMRLALLMIGMH